MAVIRLPSFKKPTPIDVEIDMVLKQMRSIGVNHEDYPKLMTYLERLEELRKREKAQPLSRDTIALVLGNLAGIILIVAYEQKHVITSKGFPQLIKPKT